MHVQAFGFAREALSTLPLEGVACLEIGSRQLNGSVQQLLERVGSYVGVDIAPGPGVDVVADGAAFQPLVAPDLVLCLETLEHAVHACGIVHNAGQMLKPGGWLLVTCATDPRAPHSGVDGGPLKRGEYYANVSPEDLRGWIDEAGLTLLQEGVHADRGDLYALARKAMT